MATKQPVADKLPSNAEHAEPTDGVAARRRLEDGRLFWLATVRPDGAPHVMPVLAVWLDNALYFVSGQASRKARNLARKPHCVITAAAEDAQLVVEGQAVKVTDAAHLQRVADVYASKYAWHVRVRNGAYDADYGAPTAGPPPYEVYEVAPTTVFAFGTAETFSPTRWRFSRVG
jgi:nitroimidazol reductase NimA-like FMN-containing flavoprotein (pyridoxamine 5'-phosphate oxidase superfamily)